jgi:uncharacterized protein
MSPMQPVCLITGASAGIGAELARVFARHQHAIVLTSRREPQLSALADAIAASGHTRPQVIVADLGTSEGIAQLSDELQVRGLEPAFVVNNAGFGLLGEASALDHTRQLEMIDLNVRALTELSLRYVESIRRHRGGILNVASTAGFVPAPGMAVYHATKAYVVSFTEALHHELKTDGIRVCALCPGPVATEFFEAAGIPHDYFPAIFSRSAGRVARDGYHGLMDGQRLVVPGKANRFLTLLPHLLPRTFMLWIMERRWKRSHGDGQ